LGNEDLDNGHSLDPTPPERIIGIRLIFDGELLIKSSFLVIVFVFENYSIPTIMDVYNSTIIILSFIFYFV